MSKYIFVMGGVMSGIGKGAATASIGKILQSKGFKVTAIKIDPYINVDAGTMNPTEHGEVFVTEDGDETDQDIGNYERFLDENIHSLNYLTTGRVYQNVIQKERNLEYGGRCVEVVPHIPEEVIGRIKNVAQKERADFVLIEIGGTVGEYQNVLFLEAARMMRLQEPKSALFVLVSYLPIPDKIGEMKTKPTQTAVRTLNSAGIQPDFLLCRSKINLDELRKRKLSIFCNLKPEDIISAPDIDSIYEIPINFEKDELGNKILTKFNLKSKSKKNDLKKWAKLVKTVKRLSKKVKIGIVGKYFMSGHFTLLDSYISVIEAIKHAAWFYKAKPEIEWVDSEEFEKNPKKLNKLKKFDGIIVPGGFGARGTEGKIKAIRYARKNKIPFLGLCFGMQLAVIEFARNVANLKGADSFEINPLTKYPVISLMPEQLRKLQKKHYGGSMRLGAYPCLIKDKTLISGAYSNNKKSSHQLIIYERHRHRYEFNNQFRKILEEKGLAIGGVSPDKELVEAIEIKNHPFFVGVQFHPEFKSRPLKPHPLFKEFINSALKIKSKS